MNDSVIDVFFWAVWFFLPAGLGNLAPIIAANIRALKPFEAPIDMGKTYRGRRIFGDHKTWRGLAAGALLGALTGGLQLAAARSFNISFLELSPFDYTSGLAIVLGMLLGIGALLGDAIESFFKRQINIAPGHSWFPFDQLDYVIGGCLLALPLVQLSLSHYVAITITWLLIHLVSSYIGFLIHWKNRPI